MATRFVSIDVTSVRANGHPLIAGGIAGFFAGAMFGAMMSATTMMENVAALIGMEAVAAGWILHFAISVVVAMAYVALVSNDRLARYAAQPSTGTGLGVTYGIVLWVAGVVFIMPTWLGFVTPANPPVPNLNWMSFVGHLIYGAFLGALYPLLLAHGRTPEAVSGTDESDASREALPAAEMETPKTETADVFSAKSVRERLENDERSLALVLASMAVERILIERIAEEADVEPERVPEFCRGEGLDAYVHTASVLGLFEEHEELLGTLRDHRNALLREAPGGDLDELDEEAERRLILDVANFLEDA